MTPDIIVKGADAPDGTPAPVAAAASPDYANQGPAQAGTCIWEGGQWICECASDGQSAGSGIRGGKGGAGRPGGKAPTLCIVVGRLLSDLVLQAEGGKGGQGAPGGRGSNGGQGQDAGSNAAYCLKSHASSAAQCPPAHGGGGGDAGQGGDGGHGGGAGDGGDIYIYQAESQPSPEISGYQIFALSLPGAIGRGGPPGAAGEPGQGGLDEAAGDNPPARRPSGKAAGEGEWGMNGTPQGIAGNVFTVILPPS
jgi:hypothetical protein